MPSLDFDRLKTTWQTLGQDDPLWAVASLDDKRGGKWDVAEFLETGERDVTYYHKLLLAQPGCPNPFNHVLDFGCGVGRLCLAWSQRARRVTGVDIASSMVARGRKLLAQAPNVDLIVNEKENLSSFPDAQFDLVASHICLQHIPWPIASQYIAEFARVCVNQGFVAFQLPSRNVTSTFQARLRKRLVDALPFGLGAIYRRWRHGSTAVFEVHFTPAKGVIQTAQKAGLTLLQQVPDESVAPHESFIYVFQKRPLN